MLSDSGGGFSFIFWGGKETVRNIINKDILLGLVIKIFIRSKSEQKNGMYHEMSFFRLLALSEGFSLG